PPEPPPARGATRRKPGPRRAPSPGPSRRRRPNWIAAHPIWSSGRTAAVYWPGAGGPRRSIQDARERWRTGPGGWRKAWLSTAVAIALLCLAVAGMALVGTIRIAGAADTGF